MMYGLFRHFYMGEAWEELVAVSKSQEKLQTLADEIKATVPDADFDIREVRELE